MPGNLICAVGSAGELCEFGLVNLIVTFLLNAQSGTYLRQHRAAAVARTRIDPDATFNASQGPVRRA